MRKRKKRDKARKGQKEGLSNDEIEGEKEYGRGKERERE